MRRASRTARKYTPYQLAVKAAKASPRWGAGGGWAAAGLAMAISAAPPIASARPARNTALGRSRNSSQAATVTRIGVRFDSTVALATEV